MRQQESCFLQTVPLSTWQATPCQRCSSQHQTFTTAQSKGRSADQLDLLNVRLDVPTSRKVDLFQLMTSALVRGVGRFEGGSKIIHFYKSSLQTCSSSPAKIQPLGSWKPLGVKLHSRSLNKLWDFLRMNHLLGHSPMAVRILHANSPSHSTTAQAQTHLGQDSVDFGWMQQSNPMDD